MEKELGVMALEEILRAHKDSGVSHDIFT